MPVKAKKATKAKRTKKVKKSAVRASAKRAKRTKKLAVEKTAKKAVARKSPAKKTVKKQEPGERKRASTSVKEAANKRATKTPTEKTAWRISPEISQSVVEIDIWKKGDLTIEHLKVYRSGWIIVDQLPDLSGYNPLRRCQHL